MPTVCRFAKQVIIHPYYANIKNHVASVYLLIWKEVQHLLLVYSIQFSRLVVSDSLQPHGLQHARLPCPSPTTAACSNSCPLSHWCHPTISSSVIPFSSRLQSFPASVLCIRWPKDWSFSFTISPSNEYSGLISFRRDWFDLLAVQGTLKSLLQPQFKSISSSATLYSFLNFMFLFRIIFFCLRNFL